MSVRTIYNLYQLAARPTFRYVLQTARNSELNVVRHFQKAHTRGIKASATAHTHSCVPNDDPTTITRTFPTSHHSLKIGFQDNLASNFYYIWLRDNCQCNSCLHTESRQKMVDTVSLDLNIKPQSYHVTDNGKLKIIWPDGHVSLYDSDWLHKHGRGFELDSYDNIHDNMPQFITWNGEMIRNAKPEISYEEVMETEEGLKRWLTLMYKYGIVILKGTPCVKNEVLKVMERITYVKKTKWGSSFDVICKPVQSDPKHLAYTGMYLELHTDMNYLEKSPGLQALHCLEANSSAEGESIGGQSSFVDGFYIAKWLRKEHPASFHVLTSTPIEFKIYSHNMEYSNLQYVLCASKSGHLKEVHYNTRTMAPIRGPADAVQPFYEAYKLMGQKMREPESQFAFNLVPGDLVAFNNRRILHGRTSFDPRRMSRHLEGCYGDIDEIITRCKSFLKEDNRK
ncbi:gamma-butyrobetaine dioxygenase [Trichonephila clavata]|uniref:Gamma-butyrobetaine dioxygenase n=1 Tax=Trichonephila clavata TaxID=2740835 RepID=A0A8X6LAP2_TRICU|nr:gamma-butyrobetaine dioxygenase [Trichonephila clavata]